jgi:hypothetical protein
MEARCVRNWRWQFCLSIPARSVLTGACINNALARLHGVQVSENLACLRGNLLVEEVNQLRLFAHRRIDHIMGDENGTELRNREGPGIKALS